MIRNITILLLLSLSYSATLLVPSEYSTIQSAIDAASDGDSVLVSAGTYYENITWPAINGIKLIGSGEDDCIIDGSQEASVIRIQFEGAGGIDSTTLITGFTIQNGYASSGSGMPGGDNGGGMFVSESSPTLTSVTFSDNTANFGGGINLRESSNPTLTNVTFSGNSANNGGGMSLFIGNSSPTLNGVIFSDNSANNGGGMWFANSSNPTLTNVTFSGNSANYDGGGMFLSESSSTLINVAFSGNSANNGGGMFLSEESNPILINSILWDNSLQEIYFDNDEDEEPSSIIITYSDIQGGWDGEGNIDADPLFTDLDNGDFTLQPTSPCIDAGDPESELDPDGTIADMGAFYYDQIENQIIYGCTDSLASNYDPDANIDDGSCEYAPHFIPETGGYPNGAMGIYITDIDIDPGFGCSESVGEDSWWYIFCDSLAVPWMAQDEIAVFDGDICVGSAKNDSGNDSPTIFVYEDNPSTPEQDGYIAGGELSFKYWHHGTQTELTNLHANYNPDWGEEPTTYYFEPFGALNAEFDVYFLNGCTEEQSCNYDTLSTIDDGCSTMEELGWCDCDGTVIDECGICGGSGIPSGECDCDGNELDCEGVCGGGAIIDECGICNGDGGDIECWNSSFACDEASCPTPFTGDMNTDGLLNILDVIILLNWILDNEPYIEYGDLNDDGYNNIIDIVLLVNWILDGVQFVTDIDGNAYQIVQIGDQLWMAENLKVTHYNNGDSISYLSYEYFGSYDEGQYGVYDNDPTNADIYGNLYNWVVVDDDRGVCPDGYHIPSDEEFMELEMELGMSEGEAYSFGFRGTDEGSKLAGNSDLWNSGNLENNGEFGTSGFNGLPAGYRYFNYGDEDMGNYGYFWSSSEYFSHDAWYRKLDYDDSSVYRGAYGGKQNGFSIRCLGD